MTSSSHQAPPCQLLAWDSEFFGFPVARVAVASLDGAALRAVEEWAGQHRPRCLYYLAPADDAASLRLASAAGFELVDVRITLAGPAAPQAGRDSASRVRDARANDAGALLPLAAALHTQTRFFADPRFGAERAAALYETWLVRSLRGEIADGVLVAEADGVAVGYATYALGGGEATIGLVGVAPAHQGRGLGRELVGELQRRCAARGARQIRVVTQGSNPAAARLYEACGFRLERVDLWFHRWMAVQEGEES